MPQLVVTEKMACPFPPFPHSRKQFDNNKKCRHHSLDVQWMTRVAANDNVADILVVGKRVVLVDVSRYQTVYLRVLGACAKQRQLVLSIDQINW